MMTLIDMPQRLEKALSENYYATPETDFEGWLLYQGAMMHIKRTVPLLRMIDTDEADSIADEFERIGNGEYI